MHAFKALSETGCFSVNDLVKVWLAAALLHHSLKRRLEDAVGQLVLVSESRGHVR